MFKRRHRTAALLTLLITGGVSSLAAETRKILFLAGEPSHGWNAHEFVAGSELLANCLNDSDLGIQAVVRAGRMTSEDLKSTWDAVVLYTDGEDRHVAKGQTIPTEPF